MTIGSTMWDSCDTALLALTARERWAAAQKIHPRSGEDYSVIVVVTLLLLALVLLLWWVSHRRPHVPIAQARDLFSDGAARRGLGARDRQMLLVIVARSGIERSHDIFITPDAFDRGAAKLLEECAHSRTAQETERLRLEVAALRERLAYRMNGKHEQATPRSNRVISSDAMATVARFPFVQAAAMGLNDVGPTDWFELVRGVVTEVSDSGLKVHSPLAAQVGERVLVVFTLGSAREGEATDDAGSRGHIILHVGRVRHRQAVGEETVITVDLTDLTSLELDELMHLAQAAVPGERVMQGA